MGREQEEIASHVVEAFQALLASDVRESIGGRHFDDLKSMVSEAIAGNSETVLKQFEAVIQRLRSEVEKRPIEL